MAHLRDPPSCLNRNSRNAMGTSFYGENAEAKAMSDHLFSKLDADRNGFLDRKEMLRAKELMLGVPVALGSSSVQMHGHSLNDTLSGLLCHADSDHDGRVNDQEWSEFSRSLYEVLGQRQYLHVAHNWACSLSHSHGASVAAKTVVASNPNANHDANGASVAVKTAATSSAPQSGWHKADGKDVSAEQLAGSIAARVGVAAKTAAFPSTSLSGWHKADGTDVSADEFTARTHDTKLHEVSADEFTAKIHERDSHGMGVAAKTAPLSGWHKADGADMGAEEFTERIHDRELHGISGMELHGTGVRTAPLDTYRSDVSRASLNQEMAELQAVLHDGLQPLHPVSAVGATNRIKAPHQTHQGSAPSKPLAVSGHHLDSAVPEHHPAPQLQTAALRDHASPSSTGNLRSSSRGADLAAPGALPCPEVVVAAVQRARQRSLSHERSRGAPPDAEVHVRQLRQRSLSHERPRGGRQQGRSERATNEDEQEPGRRQPTRSEKAPDDSEQKSGDGKGLAMSPSKTEPVCCSWKEFEAMNAPDVPQTADHHNAAINIQKAHRGKMARHRVQSMRKVLDLQRMKKVKKKLKKSVYSLPTIDDLFEIMCGIDGRIITRLDVDEVLQAFMRAVHSGLDTNLQRCVPQLSFGDDEGEDVTTGQVLNLCQLILKNPDEPIELQEDRYREHLIHSDSLSDDGIRTALKEENGCLNRKLFHRLFKIISNLMCIDEVYISTHFVWVLFGRFEMTDLLAAMLLQDCAQKVAKGTQTEAKQFGKTASNGASLELCKFGKAASVPAPRATADRESRRDDSDSERSSDSDSSEHLADLKLLKEKFSNHDMSRMSHNGGIVDAHQRTGLPIMTIGSIFSQVAFHMPDLLQARLVAKNGGKERKDPKEPHAKALQESQLQNHEYIRGRTQFSILLEALYAGIPKSGQMRSPLQLCVRMLQHVQRLR